MNGAVLGFDGTEWSCRLAAYQASLLHSQPCSIMVNFASLSVLKQFSQERKIVQVLCRAYCAAPPLLPRPRALKGYSFRSSSAAASSPPLHAIWVQQSITPQYSALPGGWSGHSAALGQCSTGSRQHGPPREGGPCGISSSSGAPSLDLVGQGAPVGFTCTLLLLGLVPARTGGGAGTQAQLLQVGKGTGVGGREPHAPRRAARRRHPPRPPSSSPPPRTRGPCRPCDRGGRRASPGCGGGSRCCGCVQLQQESGKLAVRYRDGWRPAPPPSRPGRRPIPLSRRPRTVVRDVPTALPRSQGARTAHRWAS